MKNVLLTGIFYAAIGSAVMAGIRAVEYAIPAPETRVLICTIDEMYKVEACKSLKEIRERSAARKGEEK